jgi:inositol polyphosphate 5-phosphatase INPP5J/K
VSYDRNFFAVFHLKTNFAIFSLVEGGADWIGVYREDFTGFDEYIGYEYTESAHERPQSWARKIKIEFSASIDLPLDGSKFVMLYFQSTGMRGYASMLGVSDPFTVIKRCPSPRPENID